MQSRSTPGSTSPAQDQVTAGHKMLTGPDHPEVPEELARNARETPWSQAATPYPLTTSLSFYLFL